MNPTRTLETADFSLHRVIFSSRQRLSRTFSKSTDFRCQIDLPRNQDVFRFAIRRVTFPNVANPWDLNNPPNLYFRLRDTTGGTFDAIYRVPLKYKWSTKSDVAKISNITVPNAVSGGVDPPFGIKALMCNLEGNANGGAQIDKLISGTAPSASAYNSLIGALDIFFESTTNDNALTFNMRGITDAGARLQLLGMYEADAGGDKLPSHYANPILGISVTTPELDNGSAPLTMPFPVNLTGLLHVYLTSTILTATARSMRPFFGPVENCLAVIPVASTYLTLVDHRPEAPTVWNCNQDNHWDVVDFQLRYDTGSVVDLGGNDIEIEVEFEVMEINNTPTQQMKEAIYMPYVNTHDTTKLLLKRDNRSWGSYTGTAGSRQFSALGSTSRVFR